MTETKKEEFATSGLHLQMKVTNPAYSERIAAPSNISADEWLELQKEMAVYTRDLRLGNIQNKHYERALKYLSIAGDCMSEGMLDPAKSSLRRVVDIIELSQSRGGFLRNLINTLIRRDAVSQEITDNKSNFWGKRKKDDGGY